MHFRRRKSIGFWIVVDGHIHISAARPLADADNQSLPHDRCCSLPAVAAAKSPQFRRSAVPPFHRGFLANV
jgi:hypothetical protein